MKSILFCLFLVSTFCLHCQNPKEDFGSQLFPSAKLWKQLYFSKPGFDQPMDQKREVLEALKEEINKSQFEIRAYIYSLDDPEILSALREKLKEGVDVHLLGDAEEEYEELKFWGIPIERWSRSGLHHTKIWIFDRKRIFWGTGNFTTHGLLTDHNAFWIQETTRDEADQCISLLEGNLSSSSLKVGGMEYWFSPDLGISIQSQLLDAIDKAKTSIQYLIYTHYDPVLSFALERARARGVVVSGIYNQKANPEGVYLSKVLLYPSSILEDGNEDFLIRKGEYRGGLLHHKTMIIDHERVLVGSFNYTVSARDSNREFFTETRDPWIVERFVEEWNSIASKAKSLPSPDPFSEPSPPNAYGIRVWKHSQGSHIFLYRDNGSLDANSSGLSAYYQSSLSLSPIPVSTTIGERFSLREEIPDPLLESMLPANTRLVFQNYFGGTKVITEDGVPVLRISVWEGNKPKWTVYPDADGLFTGGGDLLQPKNRWIWWETSRGVFSSCTVSQKTEVPKWIRYLLSLSRQFGKELYCQSP